MPSLGYVPDEQDVYATLGVEGQRLQQLRLIMLTVTELGGRTVTELYHASNGKPEFHVGRFKYLRALEVRRLLEDRGLAARLA